MKSHYILILFLSFFYSFSQTVVNEINQESLTNVANSYNYTYWDTNWKTSGATRSFSNQASSYALNVDYTNLNINSLLINTSTATPTEAFEALKSTTFPNDYSGDINYSILQNGVSAYEKSSSPTSTSSNDSQMVEFGTWCNRRFVSTNFTNSPTIEAYFTGIEIATWHNRFKMSFHVKPTADITTGQLRFSVEIPSQYVNNYASGSIYGFANSNDAGFVVKGGTNASTVTVTGNVIEVTTASQTLTADTSYEVSLLFYALEEDLSTTFSEAFEQEEQITITASQTSPDTTGSTTISYDENEGIHYLSIPRYGMGYSNCSQTDILQDINVSLQNTSTKEKRVRLCFSQIPNINVVGFNSVIRNTNGDPSGFPLQVSKNWHTSTSQLFSGSWIKEYTELMIPANTTLNFIYTRTGAKWGETYTASSHQLCVAGSGVPRGGWLEAALGSFGENITHSPDYEFGNSNACDVRPFLVTNENYGGTSTECGWTGNVGGFDIWVYEDASGTREYQSQVKTRFNKYSPNLTETSISAISADEKLKLDYSFYLNRSDDFTRVYYKIKVEALQSTSFNRFDIFQLGGDIYNTYNAQTVVYGNDTGLIGQFTPDNSGSNDYTTSEIALSGDNPWLWAGNGLYYTGASSGISIDTNNAMIIRDYKATFNGVENNTPYFRERSSSKGFSASYGNNPTSYCIVTPPDVSSFTAGDIIELLVEVAILPKINSDYYGPNTNFTAALTTYGNAYELLYRESLGNKIIASSPTNTISTAYPLTVETSGNTGLVIISGGKGYVPLVFSGLSSVTDPKLWKAENSCWTLVDQSVNGKDFWQTNYIQEKGTYELIYNVNQDIADDQTAIIEYYLGDTPPTPEQIAQSNLNSTGWSTDTAIYASIGDSVQLAPQVTENGITSIGSTGTWSWTGPNSFTAATRSITINPIVTTDEGTYTATFIDAFGCSVSQDFTINVSENTEESSTDNIKIYPNPTQDQTTIVLNNQEIETVKIYNTLGQDLTSKITTEQTTTSQITLYLKQLPTANYFVKINNLEAVKVIKH
jgi:hypothetical protein